MKNSIGIIIFVCFQPEVYFFFYFASKIKIVEFDVIFHFFSLEIPFRVNLIQKFNRVILRRNLVPTLACLIDDLDLADELDVFYRTFATQNTSDTLNSILTYQIKFPPPHPGY